MAKTTPTVAKAQSHKTMTAIRRMVDGEKSADFQIAQLPMMSMTSSITWRER